MLSKLLPGQLCNVYDDDEEDDDDVDEEEEEEVKIMLNSHKVTK
jgi:hypothetical protein